MFDHDVSLHFLAKFAVWHSDYCRDCHGEVLDEPMLNLSAIDVHAAPDNHFFGSIGDDQVSVRAEVANFNSVQAPLWIDGPSPCLFVSSVASLQRWSRNQDLPCSTPHYAMLQNLDLWNSNGGDWLISSATTWPVTSS
jgi:hypothetical protein